MITINGKEYSYPQPKTICQLFAELNADISQGTAIAVNNTVVPKTTWEEHTLTDNDKIIIIKATQGG